jgi:hypothetical protein
MKIKKLWIPTLLLAIILASSIQVVGSQNDDTTTLEIMDIRGGLFKVTADIKNTGNVTAENFTITLSVKGGILNNINITQICTGCGGCGTTILPGKTKSESTRETGIILGFGKIDIIVTAEAENADLVTEEATGFVLGPFVLII